MRNFVNRDEELRLVEARCKALMNPNSPLQPQVIQFHGVGGIGKTTILQRVEDYCKNSGLSSLLIDASLDFNRFSQEIINQAHKKYGALPIQQNTTLPDQAVSVIKDLMEKKPVVMLIDSLDAADAQVLNWTSDVLQEFIDEVHLCFILASQRIILFENTMPIARRLTPVPLKVFKHDACLSYTKKRTRSLDPAVQDMIFEWTGGYPLAVNTMLQTIKTQKLDPRKRQDQKQLITTLTEQVIKHGVLAHVSSPAYPLAWYQTMLTIFAVPRRCTIKLMQAMVERFAAHYKLNGNLAYMMLPKQINQAADVFNLNPTHFTLSMEAPIRHIFLKALQLDQPATFIEIHQFLAQMNEQMARNNRGTDSVRALLEYLYHSAHCENSPMLQSIVKQTIEKIIADSGDSFLLFLEEFLIDQELQTALGKQSTVAISLMYRHLAEINKLQATQSTQQTERVNYIREYLRYLILDPAQTNLHQIVAHAIQHIIASETPGTRKILHQELLNEQKILERLGTPANTILSRLIS